MSETLTPTASITYEFHDSSVPPPHHRSFRLTFDRQSARIVVDSYGDVLADRSTPMTPAVWDRVSASYPRVREVVVTEPEPGCTGGTGFALTVADGDDVRYAVSGMACGGTNSDADRILAEWVGPVRSLFEPMERLAPEG